jgi:glycosyltransferase involved in cell wall biosynthesis
MLLTILIGNVDVLRASRQADILYLPGVRYLYYALFACILFRLTGRRVIYEFHDLLPGPSAALRAFGGFVTVFVDGSEFGHAFVTQHHLYIPQRKLWTIPRTAERPADHQGGETLQSYHGKRNIVFTGQIAPHKGTDILVDAFASVSLP